jgi:hypothetical protein
VWSAAQVHPRPVAFAGAIHGDGLALGQLHHPFGLERFPTLFEEIADIVARPHFAAQGFVGGDDAPHFVLDGGEVLVGEGAVLRRRGEIVVESILGRGAEGDLSSGEQVLHRLGKDVREVVADELERFGFVARGDQRQAGIALDRPVEVAKLTVHAGGKRGFCQPRADRRRDIRGRRAFGHFPDRSVRKRYPEHLRHFVRALPVPPHRLKLVKRTRGGKR